jgi:hypothetical protein
MKNDKKDGKFHSPVDSFPGKENAGKENMPGLPCIFLSHIFLSRKTVSYFWRCLKLAKKTKSFCPFCPFFPFLLPLTSQPNPQRISGGVHLAH